jgi:hypothetical protein
MWAVQHIGMFDRWEILYDGFLDADHAWAQLQKEANDRHTTAITNWEIKIHEAAANAEERAVAAKVLIDAGINPQLLKKSVPDLRRPGPVENFYNNLRIVKYDK